MGMFGGGFLNKLGLAGDVLTGNPVTANRQNQILENDYKMQQAETARYKAMHPDPTATMQNANAGGLIPGTPAYQKWVLENGGRPQMWLGNPEAGYINPQMMPGAPSGGPSAQSGPPAAAITQLRSNPASASQFDEIFGPGAAQRALGGQ